MSLYRYEVTLGRLGVRWRIGPWRFDWAAGRSVGGFITRAMPNHEWGRLGSRTADD